jgi:HAD superfamily hydrolase (TIGR01549 family)
MLLEKYKLFIFDWDGTLSTSTALVRATRFLERRYDIGYIRKNRKRFEIRTVSELKAQERKNELFAFAYSIYSIFAKVKLKENALETVKFLKKRRKKIAVFSDSKKERIFIEMRELGMLDYVDFVLSADSIKRYKPNPTGLLLIAKKFNVRKGDVIYIGDMAADIFTARFAKIAACGIANGVDPDFLIKEAEPDYLFGNLASFLRELRK